MFKFKFDKSKFEKPLNLLLVFLVLGASFTVGTLYGYGNRPGVEKLAGFFGQTPPPKFSSVDFNLFWDVWSRLEEKYVDSAKLDRDKLMYGAIKGLTRAVGDPHTEFMPPVQAQQFQQDIKGSFDGIGAEIGIKKGVLTIIAPLKDNPAYKAGIKAGDKIFKIDDTFTADLALDEAVHLIRGPHGTTVRLLIMREGFSKPQEFKVVRDVIHLLIVETEQKPDGIFVIKLRQFTENAGVEFRKAVKEFYESGSQKLILDVRGNPGGFLTVSVDIASWFVPAGDVIARERFSDGSQDVYRSNGYGLLEHVPTVVLIDEGSASASEILAGALRDLRHTPLIGTKSYGKGSVQEVNDMPRNSSLKVTIAKWLTPNSIEIDAKGLDPDIKVDLAQATSTDDKVKDMVMEKAIEVLRQTNIASAGR